MFICPSDTFFNDRYFITKTRWTSRKCHCLSAPAVVSKTLGILKIWLLSEVFEHKLSMFSKTWFSLPQSTYFVIALFIFFSFKQTIISLCRCTKTYWEPCQRSKMELFVEKAHSFWLLTVFGKKSILEVCQVSKYIFDIHL